VIWLSKARDVRAQQVDPRRRADLLPWFGPHATEAKFPGTASRAPSSGKCQDRALRDGATRLTFRILQDDATRAQWPHASEAYNIVTVGHSLDIELVTRNTGNAAVTIGDAFHTYFEVGDIRRCTIHGSAIARISTRWMVARRNSRPARSPSKAKWIAFTSTRPPTC